MHRDPTAQPADASAEGARVARPRLEPARVRERIEEVVEPVVAAHKCELVELDWRREPTGWVLRLYVERLGHDPRHEVGGVGIDECGWISRDVSTALDVADLVDHAYNLEVSSPGLERPLGKAEHYRRFVGLRAKLRLDVALEAHPGRKAYKGEILGERDGIVSVRDDDVGAVELPLEHVQRASLVYEPAPKVKPGKQKKPARDVRDPAGHHARDDVRSKNSKKKGAAPGAAALGDAQADQPRKARGDSEQER